MTKNPYTKKSQTRSTIRKEKENGSQSCLQKWLGVMEKAWVLELHNFRSKLQV